MKYLNILKRSIRQVITSKLYWLYICIALILSSRLAIESLTYVTWFLGVISSLTLLSALVYVISQKEFNHLDISVPDSVRKGWSKVIQVGLINILFLTVFFVLFRPVGLLLDQFIPRKHFLSLALALFLRPMLVFGMCAIIINNDSVGKSAWSSVIMFWKNSLQSTAMSGVLLMIQQVFLGFVILLMGIGPFHEKVVSSTGALLPIFKILEIPTVIFWGQVLSLLVYPWVVITFTHMYLQFVHISDYSGVSPRQEAA